MDDEKFLIGLVKAKYGEDLSIIDGVKLLAAARRQFGEHKGGGSDEEKRASFAEAYLT